MYEKASERHFFKRHWKAGLAVLAAGLWIIGLTDQLESLEMVARYVGLSVAMVAVAALV